MKKENPLSDILLELSDALEDLALLLAKQKAYDPALYARFRQLTAKIRTAGQKAVAVQTLTPRQQLKKAYKKGFLKNWLIEKNVKIGRALESFKVDDKLFKVADFLADHYDQLEDFYHKLKISQVRKKDEFIFTSTRSYINYIRKWAQMLVKAKLIDGFETLNARTIEVDTALIKEATSFINGLWLEVFLRSEIARFMLHNYRRIRSFDLLSDIEVVLPNNQAGELDVLVMINEHVFWFECKSGKIGKEYYDKYGYINRQVFHLDDGHSFLLLPDLEMHQPRIIEERTGMKAVFARDLDKILPMLFAPAFDDDNSSAKAS